MLKEGTEVREVAVPPLALTADGRALTEAPAENGSAATSPRELALALALQVCSACVVLSGIADAFPCCGDVSDLIPCTHHVNTWSYTDASATVHSRPARQRRHRRRTAALGQPRAGARSASRGASRTSWRSRRSWRRARSSAGEPGCIGPMALSCCAQYSAPLASLPQ